MRDRSNELGHGGLEIERELRTSIESLDRVQPLQIVCGHLEGLQGRRDVRLDHAQLPLEGIELLPFRQRCQSIANAGKGVE